MNAELGIGFKLFKEKYMSKVTCERPKLVKAVAADSTLFNDMTTTWKFTPNLLHSSNATAAAAADHPSCWVNFNIHLISLLLFMHRLPQCFLTRYLI
ncbi:unnamed protein product [Rhizopus stolonifer]